MTQYTVQAPDGHTLTIEGPPGATQEQVMAQAQALYKPGTNPGGSSQHALPANPTTPEGTQMQGDIPGGPAGAFIARAGHELFGLGDVAGSLAHMATDQRHLGYKQAYDEYMSAMKVGDQNHPVASTAGTIAGGADAAIATAPLAGGVAAKMLPKAAQGVSMAAGPGRALVGNLARMGAQGAVAGATTGAAIGAGQGAATGDAGQVIPQAAGGAAGGAATGAVLAPATGAAAALVKKAAPGIVNKLGQVAPGLNDRVANTLSKLFDERPADIKAAYDQHVQANGAPPTLAELADYKQRALISGAAKNSTPINTGLAEAAPAQEAARAANFQEQAATQPGQNGPVAPQTPAQAQNAVNAQGDVDYGNVRQQTFQVPGAHEDVPQPGGGPSPYDVVQNGILPHTTLTRSARQTIAQELDGGYLSGNSVDLIRSNLMERARAKPGEGFAERADDFLDLLQNHPGNEAGSAAIDQARANYAAGAQRQSGTQLGQTVTGNTAAPEFAAQAADRSMTSGSAQGGIDSGARAALAAKGANPSGFDNFVQRLATDTDLHANIARASGADYADAITTLAKQEAQRSAASAAITPRAAPAASKGINETVNQAAHGLATVASHGAFYKVLHGMRWALGDTIPDNVANVASKYLSDPKMVQQGLNILQKSGASNDDLARVMLRAASASGAAGGAAGAAAAGQ